MKKMLYILIQVMKNWVKFISKVENINNVIKKLNLKIVNEKKYYNKSFELGIPQIDLNKLKIKFLELKII